MRGAPRFEDVRQRVLQIAVETLTPESTPPCDRPLIAELGFDSLDMIELSFALEEFFGFEFSSRNALEELDSRLGPGRLIEQGLVTSEGRQVVLERMPELRGTTLPEELAVATLPSYFSLDTFARLIHEIYEATPDFDPESGEEVHVDDFKILTASGSPVEAPTGDQLLDAWLTARSEQTVAESASR